MGAGQSRRNRHRRKARPGGEATYDGVTDFAVFNRDYWSCRMPECLCPDGRALDRRLWQQKPTPGEPGNPWRPSIDHIIPLAEGGWDIAANKRAAHQLCNEADQPHWRGCVPGSETAAEHKRRGLTYAIGEVIDLRAVSR